MTSNIKPIITSSDDVEKKQMISKLRNFQFTDQVDYESNTVLYVETGIATEKQLRDCFMSITQFDVDNHSNFKSCKFSIVMQKNQHPITKKWNTSGYAYVWISDPKIFNMLLGKNPDGSHRIGYRHDPRYTIHSSIIENGDIEPIIPQIQVELPPLLTIPGYKYTSEQISILKQQITKEECVPNTGFFRVSAALVRKYIEDKSTNVLTGLIPNWIDEKIMLKFFRKFSTSPSNKYPQVKILVTRTRRAFVTFSPNTIDGPSTRLMVRNYRFSDPKGIYNDIYLRFDHPPQRHK